MWHCFVLFAASRRETLSDLNRMEMYVEDVLHRDVQRFRGGLVFKEHRRVYHSTLGLRVTMKKREDVRRGGCFAASIMAGRMKQKQSQHHRLYSSQACGCVIQTSMCPSRQRLNPSPHDLPPRELSSVRTPAVSRWARMKDVRRSTSPPTRWSTRVSFPRKSAGGWSHFSVRNCPEVNCVMQADF